MNNSLLYKKIISDRNIYSAIYSVNSYIFEKELLSDEDYRLLHLLKDKFNIIRIEKLVTEIRDIIKQVIIDNNFFKASVYFRPKKIDSEDEIHYRPIHTASLRTQIAIVAIMNALLIDEYSERVELSEFAKILPHNFYGNIPTAKAEFLFEPWQYQYKKYSNNITEAYDRYLDTKEYSHEITLDLINFFPSINPLLLYDKIIELFAIKYHGTEMTCLRTVVLKLLVMEITNIDDYETLYYGKEINSSHKWSKGVTQGLPQAYFWGNLCMLDVSKYFESNFPGNSYYYVDDSVIYSNVLKDVENTSAEFKEKLINLNDDLSDFSKEYKSVYFSYLEKDFSDNIFKDFIEFNTEMDYCIKVHSDDSKSGISEVDNKKLGQSSLNMLSKEASLGAFELKTVFSDSEDITLKNKFSEIQRAVEYELKRVKRLEDTEDLEQYKKLLRRFKKYFKFRHRLINFREEGEVTDEEVAFIVDALTISESSMKNDLDNYFACYDEDIFLAELLFILKNNRNKYDILRQKIRDFDKVLLGTKYSKVAYLTKVSRCLRIVNLERTNEYNYYKSLEKYLNRKQLKLANAHRSMRLEKVKKITDELAAEGVEEWSIRIFDEDLFTSGYFSLVSKCSSELKRMLLNGVYSHIIGVPISDYNNFTRTDNSPISYYEFRLLTFLRNKRYEHTRHSGVVNKILSTFTNDLIDYTLFEIVEYYRKYVKEPELIDDLILVHKYTSELWKNGSKYLHFYTLHNHEHAVELIKSISLIVKAIDYIQISKFDYYILFISCYLHDISMVLHPDLQKLFSKDTSSSNLIYSEFKNNLSKLNKNIHYEDVKSVKELMVSIYKSLDEFYEEEVRNSHAVNSANFIKSAGDLKFIDILVREVVANVSASHGYETHEVYGMKSSAKTSNISTKYCMILLRLADLLDMSDNRITSPILDNNKGHMGTITLFHWLSHKMISGFTLSTEYYGTKYEEGYKGSYLSKNSIEERLVLTIKLNSKHLINTKRSSCDKVYPIKQNYAENGFTMEILDNPSKCDNQYCNFMCKWMADKNYYMYEEFFALKKYLNRSNGNYFNTTIFVKYEFLDGKGTLSNEEYEQVSKYLNR